ncbi:hypothetical protein J437_LFUL002618 [Ladona fulva]|uniref:PiggyBac transposable element-derived protein domain-containing protein n=1 Tax=Ladona fulva TaxID=123851 RepID=A0A8K0JUL3_LADFU|nr:hypothetical protein J437_LFUL002618 [Ladona fulva]
MGEADLKLVIDESLVLFKGHLGFKQYIPSKRHRFGMKLFILCDCETGIVLDMIVYTGKKTDIIWSSELGLSGEVVKKLMGNYLGKGHILYTDNYYTSPNLCDFLLKNKTGSWGTVRVNRKNMPTFHKKKMVRGDIERQSNGNMIAMKWHNKRDVCILSTVHKGQLMDSGKKNFETNEVIFKPDAVVDYIKNMRLVDKLDMMVGSVEFQPTNR